MIIIIIIINVFILLKNHATLLPGGALRDDTKNGCVHRKK